MWYFYKPYFWKSKFEEKEKYRAVIELELNRLVLNSLLDFAVFNRFKEDILESPAADKKGVASAATKLRCRDFLQVWIALWASRIFRLLAPKISRKVLSMRGICPSLRWTTSPKWSLIRWTEVTLWLFPSDRRSHIVAVPSPDSKRTIIKWTWGFSERGTWGFSERGTLVGVCVKCPQDCCANIVCLLAGH